MKRTAQQDFFRLLSNITASTPEEVILPMKNDLEYQLKSYMVCLPETLKPTMLTYLGFILTYRLMSIGESGDYLHSGLIASAFIALIVLIVTVPRQFRQRSKTIDALKASNLWDAALADFADAEEFVGIGLLGKRFFFGFNTSVIVDLETVREVALIIHTTKDSDGDRHTTYRIKFITDHGSDLLCDIQSKRNRKAVTKLLEKLNGRFPFDDILLNWYPQFR